MLNYLKHVSLNLLLIPARIGLWVLLCTLTVILAVLLVVAALGAWTLFLIGGLVRTFVPSANWFLPTLNKCINEIANVFDR